MDAAPAADSRGDGARLKLIIRIPYGATSRRVASANALSAALAAEYVERNATGNSRASTPP